jgi:hypothetical protein
MIWIPMTAKDRLDTKSTAGFATHPIIQPGLVFLLECIEGLYRIPPALGPGPAIRRTAVTHHRRLGFAGLSIALLTFGIVKSHTDVIYGRNRKQGP